MRQLLQATFRKLTRVKPLDFSSTMAKAPILPLDVPIEEERAQDYDSRNFYPVQLGEIFNDAYEVVCKVGFGGNSTVWLARNIHRCVSIKTPIQMLLKYYGIVSRIDMLL